MRPSFISRATLTAVLQNMGYKLIEQEENMLAYDYIYQEVEPIFLYLDSVTEIPLGAVASMLEEKGINLDLFYATFDAL